MMRPMHEELAYRAAFDGAAEATRDLIARILDAANDDEREVLRRVFARISEPA